MSTGLAAVMLAFLFSACREGVQLTTTAKQCGVNWEAGREVGDEHLEALLAHNITWIIQTPFGWQRRYDDPVVHLRTDGGVFWGETDDGLRETARLARARGIKSMLKPHLWLSEKPDGKWRAEIDFTDEAGWQKWFASYSAFMLHYAKFAAEAEIEILCIGTELANPALEREADWRELISAIREVYPGKLTYAANWYREYEEIRFWDALDFIGIQGYFPLSDQDSPSVAQLVDGWRDHARKIASTAKKFGIPVLFTEQGYKSTRDTAKEPWQWPQDADMAKVDVQAQANCYEAFYRTFWHEPWVAGVYWWKWHPMLGPNASREAKDPRYTPQGKPASDVLSAWFGAD